MKSPWNEGHPTPACPAFTLQLGCPVLRSRSVIILGALARSRGYSCTQRTGRWPSGDSSRVDGSRVKAGWWKGKLDRSCGAGGDPYRASRLSWGCVHNKIHTGIGRSTRSHDYRYPREPGNVLSATRWLIELLTFQRWLNTRDCRPVDSYHLLDRLSHGQDTICTTKKNQSDVISFFFFFQFFWEDCADFLAARLYHRTDCLH